MIKIQKLFSFNQGRNIWRIILTDLDQIVIEERDIQNKEVFYSCIDRQTGKFFWKNKTYLNEKFWIGIEGTISKYLILHQFEKPDMPNHKKIINVDLITGEILWVNEELTFHSLNHESIYAYLTKFDDREFYQLSIENGELKKILGDEIEFLNLVNSIPEKDYSKYSFAESAASLSSDDYQKEIIAKVIGNNNYLNFCEFIDKNNYLIFNYYDKIEPRSLINRLVVFDKLEEKPVLIKTLNTSSPAPVPDSFFMYENDLYFIKDKTELEAYRLTNQEA